MENPIEKEFTKLELTALSKSFIYIEEPIPVQKLEIPEQNEPVEVEPTEDGQ